MSLQSTHGLYAVSVDPDSFASAVILAGITAQNLPIESMINTMPTDGAPYAAFQALVAQKITPNFTSVNIAQALATVGLLGLRISSATRTGLKFYAQKQKEGGARDSGSVHRSYTIREGMLVARRITCDHQGDAEISIDALVTWDGTNEPLIPAAGVALPAITVAERFSLGPIVLGGVTLTGFRRVEIDLGINAETLGSESDIWDPYCRIADFNPQLKISGIESATFGSGAVPLTSLNCTHANSSVVFRKRATATPFVAQGVAEHIKFTVCGMAVIDGAFDAKGNAVGDTSIRVPLRWDLTNLPITANVAATY